VKRTVAVLSLLLLASVARADFTDNFNGSALGPWWSFGGAPMPNPQNFGVSGGMLHVTGMAIPPNVKISPSNAFIQTTFPPVVGDYEAKVRLSLEPGQSYRDATLSVGGAGGAGGGIVMHEAGVGVRTAFQPLNPSFPSPGPGFHEYSFIRRGTATSFYVDGDLLTTLFDGSGQGVSSVRLEFRLFYPGMDFPPVHVDYVSVVPSPGAGIMGFLTAGLLRLRRSGDRPRRRLPSQQARLTA